MLSYLYRRFFLKQLPIRLLAMVCCLFIFFAIFWLLSPSDAWMISVLLSVPVIFSQVWHSGIFLWKARRFKRQWDNLSSETQAQVEQDWSLGDRFDDAFFTSYCLVICELKWNHVELALLPYSKIKWVQLTQPSPDLPFQVLYLHCAETSGKPPKKYQMNLGLRTDITQLSLFLKRLEDYREGIRPALVPSSSAGTAKASAERTAMLLQSPIVGIFAALLLFLVFLIGAFAAISLEPSLLELGCSRLVSQFWGSSAIVFLMGGGAVVLSAYYLFRFVTLIRNASPGSSTQIHFARFLLFLIAFVLGITIFYFIEERPISILTQSAKLLF